MLEFDPQGNLVKAWGGPGEGYVWPGSNHGISIDKNDNVWIGGNGTERLAHPEVLARRQAADADRQAEHGAVRQHRVKPRHTAGNSTSMEHFGRVAKVSLDNARQRGLRRPTAT